MREEDVEVQEGDPKRGPRANCNSRTYRMPTM